MIKAHCFTGQWLDTFRKQKNHSRIDKIILEKMIYALHLLEELRAQGLEFVFKGGTSLVLLLAQDNRFSIDIDIICITDRKELESIFGKIIGVSRFTSYELDTHRSYLPGVPKAHYKFSFETNLLGSGTILLDILLEKQLYPELIEKPIKTKWIDVENEYFVTLPSVDSITGDKLTAFAPNTIGIPYFKGRDRQPFSMEICKQLFDLSRLFEQIQDVGTVAASFIAFSAQEIAYRKTAQENPVDLTPEDVLQDTLDTCLILAKRGTGSISEQEKFIELQKGIRAFGTGFLMSGTFRIDDAIIASARIAYLTAKLMANDLSPIHYYKGQNVSELIIEDSNWNFLNRLKRQPDKSSFYYWYLTVRLLKGSKHNL
jgi:hypothetical protein